MLVAPSAWTPGNGGLGRQLCALVPPGPQQPGLPCSRSAPTQTALPGTCPAGPCRRCGPVAEPWPRGLRRPLTGSSRSLVSSFDLCLCAASKGSSSCLWRRRQKPPVPDPPVSQGSELQSLALQRTRPLSPGPSRGVCGVWAPGPPVGSLGTPAPGFRLFKGCLSNSLCPGVLLLGPCHW